MSEQGLGLDLPWGEGLPEDRRHSGHEIVVIYRKSNGYYGTHRVLWGPHSAGAYQLPEEMDAVPKAYFVLPTREKWLELWRECRDADKKATP
jgi:hypothetical protein